MTLWQDIQLLLEVLPRIAVRVFAFGISCACLYQAYHAGISALMGVNTEASAPVRDPSSASNRFGALVWCLIALALAAVGFCYTFDIDIFRLIFNGPSR